MLNSRHSTHRLHRSHPRSRRQPQDHRHNQLHTHRQDQHCTHPCNPLRIRAALRERPLVVLELRRRCLVPQ